MGSKYECFAYPLDVDGFEKAYYEDIKDDKDSVVDQQRVKQIRVKPFKVTIEGVSYIWLQNTNELFNYELYKGIVTVQTSLIGQLAVLRLHIIENQLILLSLDIWHFPMPTFPLFSGFLIA